MNEEKGTILITWDRLETSPDEWSKHWKKIRPVVMRLVPEWSKSLSSSSFVMMPGTSKVAEELKLQVRKIDPCFDVNWEQEYNQSLDRTD